jgi:hypothetical protein
MNEYAEGIWNIEPLAPEEGQIGGLQPDEL